MVIVLLLTESAVSCAARGHVMNGLPASACYAAIAHAKAGNLAYSLR